MKINPAQFETLASMQSGWDRTDEARRAQEIEERSERNIKALIIAKTEYAKNLADKFATTPELPEETETPLTTIKFVSEWFTILPTKNSTTVFIQAQLTRTSDLTTNTGPEQRGTFRNVGVNVRLVDIARDDLVTPEDKDVLELSFDAIHLTEDGVRTEVLPDTEKWEETDSFMNIIEDAIKSI